MRTGSTTRLLIGLVIVGFLGGQVLGLALVGLVGPLVGDHRSVEVLSLLNFSPAWFTLTKMTGIWIGLVGASVLGERYLPGYLGALRPQGRDWRYLGYGAALQVLVNLAYLPFHVRNLNGPTKTIFLHVSTTSLVLLGVAVTLLAPIAEELLFRGVLVTALQRLAPTRSWLPVVVLVDGLLFGGAHGELVQLPGLAFLGMVLAYTYTKTARVLPGIMMHAGFNAVAFVGVLALRAGGHA
jgi:membrane protease YdiL (CAAX protease family)